MMANFRQTAVVLVAATMVMLVNSGDAKCAYEAIFNFGDSNTDTGNVQGIPAPNGMTYFHKPAGRTSDGRVLIDFLAQALGMPFLSPYSQQSGSDYRRGVNFATQAATVIHPSQSQISSGVNPNSLDVQLSQMKSFKSNVDASKGQSNLPPPDVFRKALYTIYIGQNDVTGKLESGGVGGVQQSLSQVVNQIASTIKELYELGGRNFMVLNVGPIGCYPAFLVRLSHSSSDLDKAGCMTSYNKAVEEYNNMLKNALAQTRQQLSDANVIYVDNYAILLELFHNPQSHGLTQSTKACCGEGGGSYNYNQEIFCGHSKDSRTASACSDPNNYISWDGIHITEVANKHVASAILGGSYVDPPFDLHKSCDIQSIG